MAKRERRRRFRRHGRGRRRDSALPREEIELRIESLAYGGDGVARLGNLVYFVSNALPGERVRVRVTAVQKQFVRAETVKILERSPDRCEPFCPYYGVCGGCVFQHLSYAGQLKAKRQMLEELLCHLGGFHDIPVEEMAASPAFRHYRNHITFLRSESSREPRFGFVARDNHTLIEVDTCPIADERINAALPGLRRSLGKLPFGRRDRIRKVVLRTGTGGPVKTGWIFKGVSGIRPEETLEACVEGKVFRFSMEAFFQTNYSILPGMIQKLREMLAPAGRETLLDLYAGAGFFSVLFAGDYREVIGIEEGAMAVHDAVKNFRMNGVSNAGILRGKAEAVLGKVSGELRPPVHVILDPPRTGTDPSVLDRLNRLKVSRMVYISCEPSILSRDLKRLSVSYRIKRVVPLDMFPHTKHLETLVLLEP